MPDLPFIQISTWARTPTTQAVRRLDRKAGARKRTALDVAREAEREPGYAPHVQHPDEPVLLWGMRPKQAAERATAQAKSARDSIGRKVKTDAIIIGVAVASYPTNPATKQVSF